MSTNCVHCAVGRRIAIGSFAWFGFLSILTLIVLETATPAQAAALVFAAAAGTAALSFHAVRRTNGGLLRTSEAMVDANVDLLEVLGGAVAKREAGPGSHCYRVVLCGIRLADELGLSPADTRALIKGAFVHDIGNVVLSDAILLKPDRLDAVEFEAVKTHCYHGADIVGRSRWLADASDVVRYHHEKWDGTGYPLGLSGTEIPMVARVFAVIDVFDALTSPRPYRAALDFDRALDIMLVARGGHFDPDVFDAFARIAPAVHQEWQAMAPEMAETIVRTEIFHRFRRLP